MLFVIKASHDVSNSKIAAGVQRTQGVVEGAKTVPVIGGNAFSYSATVGTVLAPRNSPSNIAQVDKEDSVVAPPKASLHDNSIENESKLTGKVESLKAVKTEKSNKAEN